MRLGISTGGFIHLPILDALPRIAGAGVSLVEVSTWKPHFDLTDRSQVEALQRALVRCGLRAHSLHAPFAWGHELGALSPTAQEPAVRMARLAAEVATALGAQVMVVHPLEAPLEPGAPELAPRLEAAGRGLAQVMARCRELALTLVVEVMVPHLAGGRPEELRQVTAGLGVAGWAYCLDTSHAALSPLGVGGWVQALGGRLGLVHLSDNRGQGDDHLPPGQGSIDWGSVRWQLGRAGYDGVVMLELNPAHAQHLAAAAAAARRLLGM